MNAINEQVKPTNPEVRIVEGDMKMLFDVKHPNFLRPLQIFYQPMPSRLHVADQAICKIYEEAGAMTVHKIGCFDCALGLSFDEIRSEVLTHLAKRVAQ